MALTVPALFLLPIMTATSVVYTWYYVLRARNIALPAGDGLASVVPMQSTPGSTASPRSA